MKKVVFWLKAFRLRTLPLSFSSVILGSFLAFNKGYFELSVLIGALITTLFLQVLSNLANDYGDAVKGVDNDQRVGPARSVQSGEISLNGMKRGIIVFTILSLFSGIWLLAKGTKGLNVTAGLIMLGIGLVAIAAAIKYTVGKKPYGYAGLGDLSVFLFFGLTGVLGTYFLHSQQITLQEFLPAISIGLLATAVLNLNNLRDRENDKVSGKRSLVVIMGAQKAKIYHGALIILAMSSAVIYTILNYKTVYQFLFLITLPVIIQNLLIVKRNQRPSELDPELKKLSIATLIFAITFGVGLIY